MGRLSKIKRELIQEANRRLLGEAPSGLFHCKPNACVCSPDYPIVPSPAQPWGPGIYNNMTSCWNDSSNCCNDIIYGVDIELCDGGLIHLDFHARLDGTSVKQSDIGTQIGNLEYEDESGSDRIDCGTIVGVFIWEPPDWYQNTINMSTNDDCCPTQPMRYTCKGPLKQPTSTKVTTDVSIKERVTKSPLTSSCVEDPNGEFATLQECQENCEAGYGPGYVPDAGTAAG